MTDFEIIARDEVDQLGEGPLWRAADQSLWWVDIVAPALNRLAVATGAVERWAMPEPIGWVVERAGGGLLAGFRSGIAALDPDTRAVDFWVAPEPDRPHNRLNDAKVDATGRLWFGSKDDRDLTDSGALYAMGADRRPRRQDDGYQVANGPAFSRNGQFLYHTDSGRRIVYRFAVGDEGTIGESVPFLTFDPAWGYPDGMTVDAQDCLWIAHWGGGAISRFDPDGRRMLTLPLPAHNVTSCAFGGAALDRLYVTSAAMTSPGTPADGALFVLDVGVGGCPATAFAG
ncbi:SMP-30/gluconolactonase/LRE family protein [Sphingomonas sp.]|uniref:SMP-30/gluconolactonase/LRE family protein n=1 Tax=Sphingomonas sp. TaxID=28214 RepID=UPI000DBBE812|nr:SMP-30/gluconolactonase/LRE family protein [Sphingomonas sp.]PZT94324.1 MAG: gluconolaconase [Sphingomonas sp.]